MYLPPLQQPSEFLLLSSLPMCCFFLALRSRSSILPIIALTVVKPAKIDEPLTWRRSFVLGGISLRASLLHLDKCRHRMSLGIQQCVYNQFSCYPATCGPKGYGSGLTLPLRTAAHFSAFNQIPSQTEVIGYSRAPWSPSPSWPPTVFTFLF